MTRTTNQLIREFAQILDGRISVPARALIKGDVTSGSGETVISASAGIRTPRGKVDVVLEKDGRRRTSLWGANTMINVIRG